MNISLTAGLSWAAGALVLAGFFVFCARMATRPAVPYQPLAARWYRIRPFWLVTLGGTLLALLIATIPYLPYASSRSARLGPAAEHVTVHASQYLWNLSSEKVSSGKALEFVVSSDDVNHGFGIYDPSDHIVGQVQAMPSFDNHLVLKLDTPGDYTIRCLEYCGPGHARMVSHFTVCGQAGC